MTKSVVVGTSVSQRKVQMLRAQEGRRQQERSAKLSSLEKEGIYFSFNMMMHSMFTYVGAVL